MTQRFVSLVWGTRLSRFRDESGQTLTEYAMILTFVVVVVIVAVRGVGSDVNTMFSSISGAI